MKDEIARYLENNNLLFSEWKERHKAQGYTSFIQDGIVEPEVWFGESHRILFILKEAYNGDGIPNVDSNLIEELKLNININGCRIEIVEEEKDIIFDNSTNTVII